MSHWGFADGMDGIVNVELAPLPGIIFCGELFTILSRSKIHSYLSPCLIISLSRRPKWSQAPQFHIPFASNVNRCTIELGRLTSFFVPWSLGGRYIVSKALPLQSHICYPTSGNNKWNLQGVDCLWSPCISPSFVLGT